MYFWNQYLTYPSSNFVVEINIILSFCDFNLMEFLHVFRCHRKYTSDVFASVLLAVSARYAVFVRTVDIYWRNLEIYLQYIYLNIYLQFIYAVVWLDLVLIIKYNNNAMYDLKLFQENNEIFIFEISFVILDELYRLTETRSNIMF